MQTILVTCKMVTFAKTLHLSVTNFAKLLVQGFSDSNFARSTS